MCKELVVVTFLLIASSHLPGIPRHARAAVTSTDVLLVEDVNNSLTSHNLWPHSYLSKVACAILEADPKRDLYDVIFVFATKSLGFLHNIPMGITVFQNQGGIGKGPTNLSSEFCTGRLKHAVNMAQVDDLPDDPDRIYTAVSEMSLTGVQVMAHELGHYWLAHSSFDRGDGYGRQCLLRAFIPPTDESSPGGRMCSGQPESAYTLHWSYYFASESVMFGNQIEQIGERLFRFYNDGGLRYGPLDQYLMGLRGADEVGPLFYVRPDVMGNSARFPVMPGTEKEVSGRREEFTVDDIILADGARVPPTDPCHWKGALVLVYSTGRPPTTTQIAKVARYGARFEDFYAWATDDRGAIDLTIDNRGAGTEGCPVDGEEPDPLPPDPSPSPDVVAPDPDVKAHDAGLARADTGSSGGEPADMNHDDAGQAPPSGGPPDGPSTGDVPTSAEIARWSDRAPGSAGPSSGGGGCHTTGSPFAGGLLLLLPGSLIAWTRLRARAGHA